MNGIMMVTPFLLALVIFFAFFRRPAAPEKLDPIVKTVYEEIAHRQFDRLRTGTAIDRDQNSCLNITQLKHLYDRYYKGCPDARLKTVYVRIRNGGSNRLKIHHVQDYLADATVKSRQIKSILLIQQIMSKFGNLGDVKNIDVVVYHIDHPYGYYCPTPSCCLSAADPDPFLAPFLSFTTSTEAAANSILYVDSEFTQWPETIRMISDLDRRLPFSNRKPALVFRGSCTCT